MAYASKYYDPVKAHEYYERTKVLIGYEDRYGGSRGNGTSAASTGQAVSSSNSSKSTSSSRYSDGNGKTLTATQKHNQEIKNKIQSLRDKLKNMSKEDRKNNRESIQDQIQALREQTRGGSTSGFNQKGHEAAMYIKNQMEQERDEVIKKANKDADNEMLSDVKKLAADIKAMRESGHGYSHKQFASKIKAMLGKTKKAKIKAKRKHTNIYKQKYKDEIDRLRGDKSMYTYYDRKKEREEEAKKKAEKL